MSHQNLFKHFVAEDLHSSAILCSV